MSEGGAGRTGDQVGGDGASLDGASLREASLQSHPAFGLDGLALRRRLQQGVAPMSVDQYLAEIYCQRITVVCDGGGDVAADPGLPAQIRGALGHVLAEAASAEAVAGQPCPWDPPSAYDMIFNPLGVYARGLDIPRAYVLWVDRVGEDLVVRMTIFGFACDWVDGLAEALVVALRRLNHRASRERAARVPQPAAQVAEVGPTAGTGSARGEDAAAGPPEPRTRTIRELVGVPVPPPGGRVTLWFRTPVHLRGEADPRRPGDLFSTLVKRVSGMARWHDVRLDLDWRAVRDQANAVRVRDTDLAPLAWSRAAGGPVRRKVSMAGLLGTLVLDGVPQELMALLAIGSRVHVGSNAALGLGRYDVLFD